MIGLAEPASSEPTYQLVVPSGFFKTIENNPPRQLVDAVPRSNVDKLATAERRERKGIFSWFNRDRDSNSSVEDVVQTKYEQVPPFFTPGDGTPLQAINVFENGASKTVGWHELSDDRREGLLTNIKSKVVISDKTSNFGLLKTIGGVRTNSGDYTFDYQTRRSIHQPCSSANPGLGYVIYGVGATTSVYSRIHDSGLSMKIGDIANAIDFSRQTATSNITAEIYGLRDPGYLTGLKSVFEGDVSHDNLKKAATFVSVVGGEISKVENWGVPVFIGIVDNVKIGDCRKALLNIK